jgi:hypothetical protein
MRVDREIDFHGYTRAAMRGELQRIWASRTWDGLARVRVIHGTGMVLWRELDRWCEEQGISCAREAHGGATILYPGRRATLPPAPLHRPLAHLPRRTAAQALTPETPPDPDDAALFQQALDQLGSDQPPRGLRTKRSPRT